MVNDINRATLLKLSKLISVSLSLSIIGFAFPAFAAISNLDEAIRVAIAQDSQLQGNQFRKRALEAKSIAVNTLPDPQVSVKMMNLPVDSFSFNQEAMTQLAVGVTQALPRGDSLTYQSQEIALGAAKVPLLNEARMALIKKEVSLLWLDMLHAKNDLALINRDTALFEQMVDIANASYSSALGAVRQQDVIRSQLELVQLQDKNIAAEQRFNNAKAKLAQWLEADPLAPAGPLITVSKVADQLPVIPFAKPELLHQTDRPINLAHSLLKHPLVIAADIDSERAKKSIQLAEQAYKPQFAVNASYAYRDDAPSSASRSDFFSVGVTFDVPLFTDNKQDQTKAAAVAQLEAVKTDKMIILKRLYAGLMSELEVIERLKKRQSLYQQAIVIQSIEQAEAALTAYTNDDGDFSEVVRARIAMLSAQQAALAIDIDLLKAVVRSNYYLAQANSQGVSHE